MNRKRRLATQFFLVFTVVIGLSWITRVSGESPPPIDDTAPKPETPVRIWRITWSPDDQLLAISQDLGIWLFGREDFSALPTSLEENIDRTVAITFNESGDQLATLSGNGITRIWDIESRRLIEQDSVDIRLGDASLVWQPSESLLAAGIEFEAGSWGNPLILWHPLTTDPLSESDEGYEIYDLCLNPSGDALAVAAHPTYQSSTWDQVWLIDPITGEWLNELPRGVDHMLELVFINTIACSPDGMMLAGGGSVPWYSGGMVWLWDGQTGHLQALFECIAGSSAVYGLAVNADASLVACGDHNGLVAMWELGENGSEQTLLHTFDTGLGRILELAISHDGDYLAAVSFDDEIRLWDIRTGLQVPLNLPG